MAKRVRTGFLVVAAVCAAIIIIFAVAVPNLLRRRISHSEISAPRDLQKIDVAIRAYVDERGRAPSDLNSLKGRIQSALSCDAPPCEYRGYRFRYSVLTPEPANLRYSLSAEAMHGDHSFYLDETGIIRVTSDDREATASDPPLESVWTK